MLGLLPAAASAALATFAVAAAAPSSPSTTTTISPASSPALNSSSPTLNMSSSTQTILMGSYSSAGAHVVYFTPPASANGTDGKLELGPSLFLGERASWIAQHPTEKDVVYAVLEAEPQDGQIVQARLGQDAKTVEVEGTKSTLGAAPAHCAVIANGKALAVANYAGGSVFLQPLDPDGSFSSAPGNLLKFPYNNTTTPLRNANRQEASHPHEVVEVVVDGQTEVWVPDLGQDTVWRIAVTETNGTVSWKLKEGAHLAGDEGGGPRHIAVGNEGKDLYVLNELLPAVVHSTVSGSNATFKSKTSVIPPPPASPINQATFPSGAELLLLAPTSSFPSTLLASTRTLFDRETDSLAAFDVLPSGELKLTQFVFPKGREFRAVGTSKDERFVVTGGQEDGWVSVLARDDDGKWQEVAEAVQVDAPTGVLFL